MPAIFTCSTVACFALSMMRQMRLNLSCSPLKGAAKVQASPSLPVTECQPTPTLHVCMSTCKYIHVDSHGSKQRYSLFVHGCLPFLLKACKSKKLTWRVGMGRSAAARELLPSEPPAAAARMEAWWCVAVVNVGEYSPHRYNAHTSGSRSGQIDPNLYCWY